MSESEVAEIRRKIELECQSLTYQNGYAVTARHALISQKYLALGNYQEQLARLVGESRAIEMMAEAYNGAMKAQSAGECSADP